jgi:exodeoxyribonuclease III
LAGDYNVMPTDLDVDSPERWFNDALFRPEVRDAYRRLVEQAGSTPCALCTQTSASIWDYFRNAFGRNAGLRIAIISCSARHSLARPIQRVMARVAA